MEQQPSYYALIPATVRYADISPNAKLLYGEITALANVKGYCYASNEYFAKLYRLKRIGTVSDWIAQLKKLGVIRVKQIRKEQKIVQRRIYINDVPQADNDLLRKNVTTYYEKTYELITNKRKENSTSINTTSTNRNTLSRGKATSKQKEKQPKLKSKFEQSKTKWSKQTNSDLAEYAANLAKERAANRNSELSYFEAVMRDWTSNHIETVQQAKSYVERDKSNYATRKPRKAFEPAWMHKQSEPHAEDQASEEQKQALREKIKRLNERIKQRAKH